MRIIATLLACLLAPVFLMSCFGPVYRDTNSLGDLTPDTVILVGRIEIIPKLGANEQDINMKNDILNAKDYYIGRAFLYVSDKKTPGQRTGEKMNPVLEQTFFIGIPKDKRYMVEGAVMMNYDAHVVSRRQVSVDTSEMIIPPVEFDIRPSDQAIYIGTLRFQRDEFFSVTKAQIVDDYKRASAEFREKFGPGVTLRKSLAKPMS